MFRSLIRSQNSPLWIILPILTLLFALGGCSDDDPAGPTGEQPDAQVAASLTQPTQTVTMVEENLNQVELFANPLSTIAGDAGLSGDADLDGWTGEGMSYPGQSAALAAAASEGLDVRRQAVSLSRSRAKLSHIRMMAQKADYADGDTISVEYFDTADSTGLNALVVVTAPDLVKFVVQRSYPVVLGQPEHIAQEIVLDTNGTFEDDTDDSYYSAMQRVEMPGGEISVGTLAPVSGSGPMESGVQVLAHLRVDHPRWRVLQDWNQVDIVMDPGDFRTDGDEEIYSVDMTVHWLTDAEYTASLSALQGGTINDEQEVRAVGHLTAAPADHWLESVSDTLLAVVGDLEDEEDDLLISLSRGSVFDGTAGDGGSPRHYVQFVPDEPVSPGNEPCGGEALEDIWYPNDWQLSHLHRQADLNCDGSGSLNELFEMLDGTSYSRTVTWDGLGSATVTENRADGTTVSGTFDEETGEYDITTTFSSGSDPVSRQQSGTQGEAMIEAYDVLTWQDAHADSTYFNAQDSGDSRTISGFHRDGDLREQFTITAVGTEGEEESITGEWSRNDGATGDFSLERLDGGGSHLAFSANDPAGEGSPSVTGELWYAPDGSGHGTVTFTQYGNTVTYDITFGPDGEAVLDDGNGEEIPM